MTSRKIAAFALLALLGIGGWAMSASAYSCTTSCGSNAYTGTTCHTTCY